MRSIACMPANEARHVLVIFEKNGWLHLALLPVAWGRHLWRAAHIDEDLAALVVHCLHHKPMCKGICIIRNWCIYAQVLSCSHNTPYPGSGVMVTACGDRAVRADCCTSCSLWRRSCTIRANIRCCNLGRLLLCLKRCSSLKY